MFPFSRIVWRKRKKVEYYAYYAVDYFHKQIFLSKIPVDSKYEMKIYSLDMSAAKIVFNQIIIARKLKVF